MPGRRPRALRSSRGHQRPANNKEHYGDFVVDALVDEEFDKTNPPYVVNLTHYFTVSNDKIVSLIIIRNTPVDLSDTLCGLVAP
jgi:hypothetical protein